MFTSLKQHIEKYIKIDEEALPAVLKFFHPVQLKKKENLLAEGKAQIIMSVVVINAWNRIAVSTHLPIGK